MDVLTHACVKEGLQKEEGEDSLESSPGSRSASQAVWSFS